MTTNRPLRTSDRMLKTHGPMVAFVGILVGCAGDTGALRTRVAFDFNCPQERISLTRLFLGNGGVGGYGDAYGAEGCGQRGT